MNEYEIKVRVDQTWWEILDVISRNQNGFVWLDVKVKEKISG